MNTMQIEKVCTTCEYGTFCPSSKTYRCAKRGNGVIGYPATTKCNLFKARKNRDDKPVCCCPACTERRKGHGNT